MKALLLTDLYQAWTSCKLYLLFVAVAAVVTVGSGISGETGNMGTFMSVYAMVMCSMMGMGLMQLDEASRWNVYAQALPVTRRDQVSSKYAVTLICFGGVWCLFAALFTVMALLGHNMTWAMAVTQMAALAVLGLLAPALSLPPMFRWGSNKGRVIFLAGIATVGVGAGFFFSTYEARRLPSLPVTVLIVLAVLMFVGSWALAVRWYEKREL